MIKREVITTIFVAFDGKEFSTEEECISHDRDVLRHDGVGWMFYVGAAGWIRIVDVDDDNVYYKFIFTPGRIGGKPDDESGFQILQIPIDKFIKSFDDSTRGTEKYY